MKKDVYVGLDIGIASVGWCITSVEDLKIIKHGVRLFPTVDNPKDSKLENVHRREKRSARRMNRRKKTRKRDFIKFLCEKDLIKLENNDFNSKDFINEFREKYLINKETLSLWEKENKDLFGSFGDTSGLSIYRIRAKGLKEKLNNVELINVLYWYLSNRGFE